MWHTQALVKEWPSSAQQRASSGKYAVTEFSDNNREQQQQRLL
jgi:hypothetical protein